MSCTQVASEFSSEKFCLVFEYPTAFCVWRYKCCADNQSFYVYRVLFSSLFALLVILDFFWIIGFGGAGEQHRISACVDAVQFALVALGFTYFLLTCSVSQYIRSQFDSNSRRCISYKAAWLFYTCSINAVYMCMILFWVSGGWSMTLEQKLKNSIPGCLIFMDLCLNSIPLYLCHVVYVILLYLIYLALAALGLFVSYMFHMSDKDLIGPSNPTVWIGGYPLLVNGYRDFFDLHRILTTVFGCIAIALMVHCVLLSIVITRDFFSSLFNQSSESWMKGTVSGDNSGHLIARQSFPIATTSVQSTVHPEEPSTFGDNAGFVGDITKKQ